MKIAVAGYGVEGKSALRYFKARGDEVVILDQKQPTDVPEGVKVIAGQDAFSADLSQYDLIVRSPSLTPHKINSSIITSVTKEFFSRCSAPIIGVTGSKGKGTTCSFITSILSAAGKKVHLVGNIGVPALDELDKIKKDDVVVFELSSFQLWDLHKSPHVAVVLMIEPEHLDVHVDIKEYVGAKANIRKYQTADDWCFYHPANEYAKFIADQSNFNDHAVKFNTTQAGAAYVKDDIFYIDGQQICPTNVLYAPFPHNIENACAAISAAWVYVQDVKAIKRGLQSFTGLPHRLKFVAEVSGVKYYDDSIATTPGSVIAALNAFKQPKVLILGGSDKGADFNQLAAEILQHNVKGVVSIGAMRNKVADALKAANFNNVILFDESSEMTQIVEAASKMAKEGDVVVLSPACASFDMFKSYADRGDQFISAVKALI
ncbi:MAG: UDP-N-acetylmuramoyl-L-alanine--D-glutamate ligase [Candidatus Woesebacteria bacterium]|jgi:UDP-N-acetylmuramoylalanine--D-glutamate ligase